ncbi:MAG: pilus assembly protein PilM [Thermodesulfobacteriota bacterium]|nr:pilus assembly protein PilM [Thermodesulfobacteriota bacterium]
MSSPKDISSTEKLLDLIRSNEQPDETPDALPAFPPKKAEMRNISRFFTKKSVSVGVDIGHDELKLVKVNRPSAGQWKLLDYRKIPIKAGMLRDTSEFAGFLKSELTQFCGSGKDFNLWGLIQSDKADVQNINIPKVGRRQLENTVYWIAKKNITFDEKETILDFEVQGEVVESGITKLSVLVCTASKREVGKMKDLFNGIGFPLTGLTVAPFALQNLFRTNWAPSDSQTVATLYIGSDSSRIDIFSDENLVMTRGIRAGINSMAESLMEEYAATAVSGEGTVVSPSEESGSGQALAPMSLEDAKNLISDLGSDSRPDGENPRFGLGKEKIFEMINSALERLVRQVERTFEHYTVILGNESVRFIYVFCDMYICMPMVDYVGSQLRIESGVLDPMSPESSFSGHVTSNTSVSYRVSFVSALGLALSDLAYTPNLIFTYSDKEKLKNIRSVNRVIVSAFAVIMLILVGAFFWMGNVVDKKEVRLAGLEQQLGSNTQNVENVTREMISRIRENETILKKFKKRYFGVAVIGELSKLTPTNICLLTVKANMGTDAGEEGNRSVRGVKLTGVVTGASAFSESALAKYVVELKKSPMFKKIAIDNSNRGPFNASEALHFTLHINFT